MVNALTVFVKKQVVYKQMQQMMPLVQIPEQICTSFRVNLPRDSLHMQQTRSCQAHPPRRPCIRLRSNLTATRGGFLTRCSRPHPRQGGQRPPTPPQAQDLPRDLLLWHGRLTRPRARDPFLRLAALDLLRRRLLRHQLHHPLLRRQLPYVLVLDYRMVFARLRYIPMALFAMVSLQLLVNLAV
jgi:hypothetical protein